MSQTAQQLETPAGKMMAALEPVLTTKLRTLGAMPVNYCEESIEFKLGGVNFTMMIFDSDKVEVRQYKKNRIPT